MRALAFAFAILLAARTAAADDRCENAAEEAQTLRSAGHLRDARRDLVICAAESCPAVVKTFCTRWLLEVDAAAPSLVVRATDRRGQDVSGARVVIDGRPVAERLDGAALVLDPGPHKLRVETRSGAAVEQELVVAIGEKNRPVVVHFERALAPDGSDLPLPAPPREERRRVAAYVAGGVGLASLAAFVALDVAAWHERSTLKDGCGADGTCSSSDVRGIETKRTIAAVAGGVGLAGLAVGGVLFFLPRSRSNVQAIVSGRGVSLAGSF